MTPRDLDALVAQARGIRVVKKAFCNKNYPFGYRLEHSDGTVFSPAGGGLHGHGWQHSEEAAAFYYPPVSTDLAEAMALVEEWPGDYQIRRDGQDYIVSLFSGADVYVEMADTLKAAICLAYLKAKGVEVEQ